MARPLYRTASPLPAFGSDLILVLPGWLSLPPPAQLPPRPLRMLVDDDKDDIQSVASTDPPTPSDEKLSTGGGLAESIANPYNEPYPEGGLRAWLVVFGAWAGLVGCFGMANSLGALQAYLAEGPLHDYSDGTIGWIMGINLFLSFFCGVLVGPVFDLYGPRLVVALGAVLLVLSMVLLSFCEKYWQFLLSFGFLAGFACSLIFTPAFTAPGHWFLRRRGLATGIAATGGSVGGVIFPIMLERLIPRIGFGWAIRVIGLVMSGLFVLCWLLMRTRLPPLSGAHSRPDIRIIRSAPFACLTVSFFFMEIGFTCPVNYMTSYAISAGVSRALGFQMLAILNGSSFVGRWLSGLIADRAGRFNTAIVFMVVSLVATLALWLPSGQSTAMMVAFCVVFGVASGCNIGLTSVCVGQLCRTEEYGRYYATCYMIVSFGSLIGLPVGGAIVTVQGGTYSGLIFFTAACFLVASVFAIAARGLASGWRLRTMF